MSQYVLQHTAAATLHQIVIVGGGAGGLELATRLGNSLGKKGQAKIVLIDAALTHIWKPLLHEVAAGTINSYEDELNYFAHATKHHFEFHLGRMIDIDRTARRVILEPLTDDNGSEIAGTRSLSYDTLVIAIGSTSNDFGTPGAKDHSIFLDSRPQADRFQRKFLNLYLQAEARAINQPSDQPGGQSLNIAIIGAGATGVELAAELHHAAHEFTRYGLNSIDPKNVSITVIEAADRILPVLSPTLSRRATQQLEDFDVTVLTGKRVIAIHADHVKCEGGLSIPSMLTVWSAGIKAPDILKDIGGLETNRINQLVVGPTLQTTRDDNIFAFGDCASYTPAGETRSVPPRAQVANQEAIALAKILKARLAGRPLPTFTFNDKGSLISLGDTNTVGSLINRINVQGLFARLMYLSLYRLHQVALHGVFKTAVLVGKDLLSRSTGPTLKLH